jgi:hypothetical protein
MKQNMIFSAVEAGMQATNTKNEIKATTDKFEEVEHKQRVHEAKVTKAATDAAKARAKELADLKAKEIADRMKEEDEYLKWFLDMEAREAKARADALKAEQESNDFMKKMYDEMSKEEEAAHLKRIEQKRKEDEETKKQAEFEAAAMAQRIELTQQGLQVLADLAAAFAGKSERAQKAAFEFNKAINIAQALIETYKAAQSAYASQMTIPTPDALIRAKVAAGIAIAAGLARVAAIARTKFNTTSASGASGSGSGGGGLSQEPPRLANVAGTTIDANRDQVQDTTVKVVESDIKGVSNRVNVIESQATIR